MAAPRLVRVKMLRNHGAAVCYAGPRGVAVRFERPDGRLSVPEAAALLGTYPNMVRRMAAARRLVMHKGRHCISLADCRRLLRLPRARRLTAEKTA